MPHQHRIVQPMIGHGRKGYRVEPDGTRVILSAEGHALEVPAGWELLLPGDAMLTRRVKAACAVWVMQERKGRRTIGRGVWAPGEVVARVRGEVEEARAQPGYQKKLDAGRAKRAAKQVAYAGEFESAIVAFLGFAPRYAAQAQAMAKRVADHAVPVGSGTVARTQRIGIEERARAAVVAWMRHHTTGYDRMSIPRVKGKRREVRRRLARESLALLGPYRDGAADAPPVPADCPLQRALGVASQAGGRIPADD